MLYSNLKLVTSIVFYLKGVFPYKTLVTDFKKYILFELNHAPDMKRKKNKRKITCKYKSESFLRLIV